MTESTGTSMERRRETPVHRRLEEERSRSPQTDIHETKDDLIVTMDMPGLRREDLKIRITQDELTINGGVKEKEIEDGKRVYGEIEHLNYYRVFVLSETIDREKISAKLEDGVLALTLPKAEATKPREIPIRTEEKGSREAYQEQMEAQLREWAAEIQELQAKAEKAEDAAKAEYKEQIEALRARQEEVQEKLQELKEAGDDA